MTARLTIEQAMRRSPEMLPAQRWRGNTATYFFRCDKHGRYRQVFNTHQTAKKKITPNGCPKCGTDKREKSKSLTIADAERRFPDMVRGQKWDGTREKYLFNCIPHGPYSQVFENHSKNGGCKKCVGSEIRDRNSLSIEQVRIKWPDMVEGQSWKGTHEKYLFTCDQHGVYSQRYKHHDKGSRCPSCIWSSGEEAVWFWLSNREYGNTFERQKQFSNCRAKRPLRFDFGSEQLRLLIEYQGKQHYEVQRNWGDKRTLREIQKRDRLKRRWANANGYCLVAVSYRLKDIPQFLEKRLGNILREKFKKAA